MSNRSRKRKYSRRRGVPVSTLILLVVVITLGLMMSVLMYYFEVTDTDVSALLNDAADMLHISGEKPEALKVTEQTETTEPETEPPVPVVGATGESSNVRYSASYTITQDAAETAAQKVVATYGKAQLNNAQLQVYYRGAIDAYLAAEPDVIPDFYHPLDAQLCPFGDGNLSWQHYFLQNAIASWQAAQALIYQAKQPQPITEEAFQPNVYMDLHTPNITPDLPVNDFLYCDQPNYKPNEMHQAYLDSMETVLETQAKNLGYASLPDYIAKVFGKGVTAEDLVAVGTDYNTAYMFFTERSFYVEISKADLDAYIQKHKSELPADSEYTVNMRHILLIPEGAKVDKNGKVTATEAQWSKCKSDAESMVQSWLWDYPTNMNDQGKDYNIGRWAFKNSADAGSNLNGGLYSHVRKGQLIDKLDEWCFASSRKPQDYTILRSDVGYHIVLLSQINKDTETAAREALTREAEQKEWKDALSKNKLKVDYSAAALWSDCMARTVSMESILYPDIAHERFPKAMVYLQQDYATTSYGSSTVGRGGCGVTTMAMLSTYMLDELHTPAMLAKDYFFYHDASGTMAEMFRYVPAELGFQLEKQTFQIDEVIDALKSGRRVVSLQYGGHFTSAGHYLLLQEYYPENDTFQVRDSNIANYGKLSGHKVDYFTRENLLSGGSNFFIFQPKVTRIPACTRCGDGSQPELLIHDYLCDRCIAATSRRNNFLEIINAA